MVEVGSLDMDKALLIVKQSLQLRVDMSEYADGLLHLLPFSKEVILFHQLNFKSQFPSKSKQSLCYIRTAIFFFSF